MLKEVIRCGAGCIVTGGNEAVINIFSLDSPSDEPKYSLVGHTDNVCALDVSSSGLILSGSWDKFVMFAIYALHSLILVLHQDGKSLA